jgi:biotin operon repressor BirA-like protein
MLSQANTGMGRLTAHTDAASSDRRMACIVRVLADNAMLVVSGTKLAKEIDGSRSEVWRLVEQLRALGVEIAGHPAEGYRLEAV